MKTKVSAALAVVASAFVLASCSPGDLIDRAVEKGVEKGIEAASGGEVNIDRDGGQISISTEDGEVSFGGGSEVPEGFPSEVPLIDGEVGGGLRVSEGDTDGFTVAVAAPGSISDVYDQVTSQLASAGFKESTSADMGGMRTLAYEANGSIAALGVMFVEDSDQGIVNVTYTVSNDKSA